MYRFLVILLSVALFALALVLPALTLAMTYADTPTWYKQIETWPGIHCLISGIMAPLVLHFEAYANILYMLSVCFLIGKDYRLSYILAFFALVLSMETLTLFVMTVPAGFKLEETIHYVYKLKQLEIGFYVWVLSFLIIFLYSRYMAKQVRQSEESQK